MAPRSVQAGNAFAVPTCAFSFTGDYSGITADSNGVGHSLWTDIRAGQFDRPATQTKIHRDAHRLRRTEPTAPCRQLRPP